MKYILVLLLLTSCALTPRPATNVDSSELVKVCWGDSLIAMIPTSCDKPEPIIWKQRKPLIVYAHPAVFLRTVNAVEVWNKELGFPILKVVRWLHAPMSQADVFVVPGGHHPRWLGVTGWRKHRLTKKVQSIVVLYNGSSGDTAVHELGHVLGLDHDPKDHRSIMYPNTARVLPRVQPQDLKVLRRLYGKSNR